jgi:hypothetical protein
MKLLFGMVVRFESSDYELRNSVWKKTYGLQTPKENEICYGICASCLGCTEIIIREEEVYNMCTTFDTEVGSFHAEHPDIPCSKYKKLKFKKL